ncbi:MAG: GMC family oxidoreductase [Cyclobacteriaceae bacterium]|nr:GMC family oxidoreductase [Cyclobacteriaceae bacterium]MDH4295542.1 GMC family oxidoreductase [Cyclobacteriaceae bacterium]MDH5247961.1 GMC family oxidoreductase [Cyclobacteriaceae bacterium]
MHTDARNLPNNSVLEGDICIIGAGAAGISIALDWMNSGYKVILLESGGFSYDDKVQDLYKGKTTGQKYYPMKSNRLSLFGGTTGHWAGMCSPFDNIDFIKRDWVPDSGWPITRKDLDPFYARANEKLKLGPYQYNLSYWQKEVPNLNPFPLDENVVWHKMWQISPAWGFNGGLSKFYKDDIVNSKNIHLYTYSTVTDIRANNNVSNIQHVVIKNLAGKTHTVKAKHFILAGGAIQNARILLAANTQAPRGLGNDNDIVGRYFMEHLEIQTAELWLFKPFPTDLFTFFFDRPKLWCELAIAENVQIENKILNGTAGLSPLSSAKNKKERMEIWQDEDPRKSLDNMLKNWDESSQKAEEEIKGSIERAYEFQTRIEQAPNPDSRITIGTEVDALGVPRANLHWQLTELDKRSIRKVNQIIGQQVGISGIGRVKLKEFLRDENDNAWPTGTNGGWHHMGTTRMSDDPKKGVVTANCEVHGIDNLYVAGAGCYATSGAPNPTLTLVALSLRLSDYVKDKISR